MGAQLQSMDEIAKINERYTELCQRLGDIMYKGMVILKEMAEIDQKAKELNGKDTKNTDV